MRKNKKRQNQGKEAERICKVLSYSSFRAQAGERRKKKKRFRKDRWCSQVVLMRAQHWSQRSKGGREK